MLKRKITKDEWESLDETKKGAYVESDGSYVLDIDDGDDSLTSALRAKEREKQLRKEAEQKLAEIEAQKASTEEEDLKRRGKIDVLEKSWNDKFASQQSEFEKQIESYKNFIVKSLGDDLAEKMSAEFYPDAPKVMIPHFRSRISVDFEADETGNIVPKRRILDSTGKPSALTPDELKKEFLSNNEFSGMIKATQASGSGTSTQTTRAGGASERGKMDLWQAKPDEVLSHIKGVLKQ